MNNKIRFKSLVNDNCTEAELGLFLISWKEDLNELKKYIIKNKKDLNSCINSLNVIKRNKAIVLNKSYKPFLIPVKEVKEKPILTVERRREDILNIIKNSGKNGISFRSLKRLSLNEIDLLNHIDFFIVNNLIKKRCSYSKLINSNFIYLK